MKVEREGKYFKCQFCGLKLEKYQILCQHLHLCHNVIFLECQYCDCKYLSKLKLEDHIKAYHTDGLNSRFECSRCPSTFKNESGLLKHTNTIHVAKRQMFPCAKCNHVYMTKATHDRHVKQAHRQLTFLRCPECPKIFHNKQTLKRHTQVNHSVDYERTKCPLCFSTFKYREHLSQHMQAKHYSEARLASDRNVKTENKCNICSAQFPDKTAVLLHQKSFHNKCIDIFECEECSAVFKIREAYEIHIEEEHGLCSDIPKPEHKDYECKDFVDFENSILTDFELFQLMQFRKTLKPHQRLTVMTDDQDSNDEDNFTSDMEVEELEEISKNIHSFFEIVCKKYRNDSAANIEHTNEHGSDFESDPIYTVIEVDGQINMSPECLNNIKESIFCVEPNNEALENVQCDVEDKIDHQKELYVTPENDKDNLELHTHLDIEDTKNIYISNSDVLEETEEETIEDKYDDQDTSTTDDTLFNPVIEFYHCSQCSEKFRSEELLWKHLSIVHNAKRNKNYPKTSGESDKSSFQEKTNRKRRVKDKNDELLSYLELKISASAKQNKKTDVTALRTTRLSLKKRNHNSKERVISRKQASDLCKSNVISKNVTEKKTSGNKNISKKTSIIKYTPNVVKQNPSYSCIKCKINFKSDKQLKKHELSKHPTRFKCNDCDKSFKTKSILSRHHKTAHGGKSNKSEVNNATIYFEDMCLCEECEAFFPNKELLQSHQLWEHESNVTLHKCCQCGMIYNQLGDFERHMEIAHTSN